MEGEELAGQLRSSGNPGYEDIVYLIVRHAGGFIAVNLEGLFPFKNNSSVLTADELYKAYPIYKGRARVSRRMNS